MVAPPAAHSHHFVGSPASPVMRSSVTSRPADERFGPGSSEKSSGPGSSEKSSDSGSSDRKSDSGSGGLHSFGSHEIMTVSPRSRLSKMGDIFCKPDFKEADGRSLSSWRIGIFTVASTVSASLLVYGVIALAAGAGPFGLIPVGIALGLFLSITAALLCCKTPPSIVQGT